MQAQSAHERSVDILIVGDSSSPSVLRAARLYSSVIVTSVP